MSTTITLKSEHPEVLDVDFLQGMVNRMDMSFYKYKHPKETAKAGADYIESLKQRLKLYERGGEYRGKKVDGGNLEWLMDLANFCMCEFMVMGGITSPHFVAQDSDGSPGLATSDGKQLHQV